MSNNLARKPHRWRRVLMFVLTGATLVVVFAVQSGLMRRGRLGRLVHKIHTKLNGMEARRTPDYSDDPHGTISIPVEIDVSRDVHPISPFIYGMSQAPESFVKDLRLGSNRWGGNDKSRYNWVHGNAVNAARDWNWANRVADTSTNASGPSSAADRFVQANRTHGAATVLTVPTIGYVARNTDNSTVSVNVPGQGGELINGSDGEVSGYNPAENRRQTSLQSASTKTNTRSNQSAVAGDIIYQDEWIHHLVRQFGDAAHNGVLFYAMDNEPDLWDVTHTDVHPARVGYDSLLANFLEYASAVKAADPSCQVTGPVLSGWTGFEYSSLDRGDDNFHSHLDCTNHNDEELILWFLKQVRAADARAGRRTLDVLDVHYYPQGANVYSGDDSPETRKLRVRSTRSLWDANYPDESWIGEPVRLLPRLRDWIAAGYPGTKVGITEWNFGGDQHMSGAIAVADVLGLYGRENVYLANYWAYPLKGSPAYLAYKLFRNADGHGNGFGDSSCRAVSANQNRLSCYASTESATGSVCIMLVNKMENASANVPLHVGLPGNPKLKVKTWTLSTSNPGKILNGIGPDLINGSLTLSLPPYSICLARLDLHQVNPKSK